MIDEDGATIRPEHIGGVLVWMALLVSLLSNLGRADEFRAVVVTDQESAALRAAKARADEAQAAFAKLRSATEERYRAKLNGALSLDWSTDFRVIAERRWLPPSNLQWLQPQPLYQPGGWGSVIDWSAPLGSVHTLNDGEIHGTFGGTVKPGEVLGVAR